MAATLVWQYSEAIATWSTLSGNLRFKNANDNLDTTANPMVRPTSGTDYSFQKKLRINVTVVPDTSLSSLRVYHTGSIGSGIGGGITQYYSFSASDTVPVEATTTGTGALPTSTGTAIAWTGAVDHLAGTGTGQWASSQFLYTWLGVATGGTGGSATWSTTALFNEI